MMNWIVGVNWPAVLLASVAHFALGATWFLVLFGKQYRAALGISDRSPQPPGALFLAGPFFCSALTIATTAILLRALDITQVGSAVALGVVVGVGYLGAMTVNIAINPLFPRPLYYALLNAPMFIIGSMMACAILVTLP